MLTVADTRQPDHRVGVVYAICLATNSSVSSAGPESAQHLHLFGSTIVDEGTMAIQVCTYLVVFFKIPRIPNHLAGGVYAICLATGQALHLWVSILIVEEGLFQTAVIHRTIHRTPNHLAGVVHACCITVIASESAQVLHLVLACSG